MIRHDVDVRLDVRADAAVAICSAYIHVDIRAVFHNGFTLVSQRRCRYHPLEGIFSAYIQMDIRAILATLGWVPLLMDFVSHDRSFVGGSPRSTSAGRTCRRMVGKTVPTRCTRG